MGVMGRSKKPKLPRQATSSDEPAGAAPSDIDVALEDPQLLSDESFSLDDLGAAYANALAEHDPESYSEVVGDVDPSGQTEAADGEVAAASELSDADAESYVTPMGIIEAALFVGNSDNQPLSEIRLASLMRDVTPEEVLELIDQLNQSYRQHRQALRIVRNEHGFRMTISPEVESVKRSFDGKIRETRLNQSSVEVLALVAYQPGITAQKVQDQRGRDSASLLNQLVRRQLLEMRRERTEESPKPVPRYYPTERFLYLFGLETLSDLPQVEESAQP